MFYSVLTFGARHAKDVANGRMSFPSGHSSTAFSGMIYLSLWIAGQSAAWCFSIPKAPRSVRSSRIGILCLSLLPFFWALYVALTRLQDHVSFIIMTWFPLIGAHNITETSCWRCRGWQLHRNCLGSDLLCHLLAQSLFILLFWIRSIWSTT